MSNAEVTVKSIVNVLDSVRQVAWYYRLNLSICAIVFAGILVDNRVLGPVLFIALFYAIFFMPTNVQPDTQARSNDTAYQREAAFASLAVSRHTFESLSADKKKRFLDACLHDASRALAANDVPKQYAQVKYDDVCEAIDTLKRSYAL